ncbi:peroxin, partial [Mortierella hygrophila]
MLSAVQGFANRHRKGLVITAGLTGGIYMMGKYAKSKLIEFHEKSASERTAKENIKRRFEQNQQDCVFTVLSLLPTLGDQLLHELNVELITARLQQTRSQRSTPAPTPDSSMILPPKPEEDENKQEQEGSAENKEEQKDESELVKDGQETAVAIDGTEEHAKDDSTDSTATSDTNGDSNQSTQPSSTASEADKDETTTETQDEEAAKPESPDAAAATTEVTPIAAAPETIVKDEAAVAIDRKTKLELWHELKIMSLTRTVTALYSLTFLTLLTQVQLNLLGRFTYVSS